MIKNALAYVTRKRLKSLIILLVIIAMATLSMIGLSIKDATNRAAAKTFGNITNSFTMEINRQVNSGTPRGGGNIRNEDINKIVKSGHVKDYVKRIGAVADLVGCDIIRTEATNRNEDEDRIEKFKSTVMVTGVNDKTFDSSEELVKYVNSQKLGDKVKVTYQEDGQEKSATGKIIKLENGKNGIGISLIDRTEVTSNIPIQFTTEGIGGPSAGLMFSLSIYTQLADPTLRDGRVIAGTGSINRDGEVGDIGGIDKKVVSAAKSGASIFFAPNNPVTKEMKKIDPKAKTNYETAVEAAKKIKTDMKIVPVKTLQDAIDYLKNNK